MNPSLFIKAQERNEVSRFKFFFASFFFQEEGTKRAQPARRSSSSEMRSAIMAINSLLVGLPLALDTV